MHPEAFVEETGIGCCSVYYLLPDASQHPSLDLETTISLWQGKGARV